MTGYSFDHWFLFPHAQRVFNRITWKDFTHEDSCSCFDDSTGSEMELIKAYHNGYKPHLWLHSFEIPLWVWKDKKKLAAADGYEDVDRWLTEVYTDCHWNYEGCREVLLPHSTLQLIEAASFLTDNEEELKEMFIAFVADTGNPDNLSENEFRCYVAQTETQTETILN